MHHKTIKINMNISGLEQWSIFCDNNLLLSTLSLNHIIASIGHIWCTADDHIYILCIAVIYNDSIFKWKVVMRTLIIFKVHGDWANFDNNYAHYFLFCKSSYKSTLSEFKIASVLAHKTFKHYYIFLKNKSANLF